MAEGGSNDQNGQNDRSGRPPKNLQGLLKFCVEQTKAEDAPEPSRFRELSPERKEWLKKALDEMTGDPVQEVKNHIKTVGVYLGSKEPTEEARTNALKALELLFDWCESYDMANDFLKIGGFSILHELMTHSESEFRDHSFKLMSVLVQNNPVCQKAVVEDDLLPIMLQVLDSEHDPDVQFHAVQAISCLVRDSLLEQAQQQFVANNGFGVLKKVLQTPGPSKRVTKVAFFLMVMCNKNPQYKDTVCEQGIVELLIQELKQEHQQAHEQVMGALLCLAKDHPPTQCVLCKPEHNMKQFLQEKIQHLQGKDENQEEREYAQEVLDIIEKTDDT
ncbi:hsp70-binding protein 1-like [Littorina saxatilis]|uniref:Nucleotide exchange factor Fes1 domain-containing protein n=1 Tax=Littorina saxatilis TaxID=31220 RepID=A0AAN9B4V3_9CAEN